jgi:hypothetical protein
MYTVINPVQSLLEVSLSFARSKKAQNGLIDDLEREVDSPSLVALRTSLNELTLGDLGLADSLEGCFQPNTISLINLYPHKSLWVGVFCMTQGTRFPLHDHPDMIGMTRLFQGRLAYRCMDILSCSAGISEAKVQSAGEVQDSGLLWLTPNRGNIHEIEALQDSVLLDLFLPNYSSSRVCTYFQEIQAQGDRVTLARLSQPDIPCQELPYTGLPVN